MLPVTIDLIPLILGSAIVPVQIIMAILMLTSEDKGPLKAIAFVLGMTLIRLAQGILFGLILTGGSGDPADSGGIGWVKATLLTLLGIMLLITAYKSWRADPDPDAPPPKWLTMLEGLSPLYALVMGAGLVLIGAKLWVFTLGALTVIGDAQLGQPASTLTFLLYVFLAESLLIIPIIVRLLFPTKASALLERFGDWLEVHNDQIVMVVSLIFGLLFLYNGLTGLLD